MAWWPIVQVTAQQYGALLKKGVAPVVFRGGFACPPKITANSVGEETVPKQFTIYIDGEPFEAPEKTMTANEILSLGGLSTDEHYLVEIKGKHQESFAGKGSEDIHLHEDSKFISVFTGATPVADSPPRDLSANLTGARLFAAQLRGVGYEVTELPDGHVKFPYTVDVGRHASLTLEMGFVVPKDFPMTPPHGPHINKLLYPSKSGGTHPDGGIHPSTPNHSKHFGPDWQHWSRPHPTWTEGPRTAVRYMAFIRGLWATQ